MSYKTPGVYIKEISKFPPSIAEVETAIPAFIGYTERAFKDGMDYTNIAVRIKSLVEYESIFGGAFHERITATIDTTGTEETVDSVALSFPFTYRMYYSLQLYFANGGGPCYIISVANYTSDPSATAPSIVAATLLTGMPTLKKEDEPTLIVYPDAISITSGAANFYSLYTDGTHGALKQCADLMDRFALVDIYQGNLDFNEAGGTDVINSSPDGFRSRIGTSFLKYGAAYYPWLRSVFTYQYNENQVSITGSATAATVLKDDTSVGTSLFHINNALYNSVVEEIKKMKVVLAPSAAIAGVYATVDNSRGVWKAPANISLNAVIEPLVRLDNDANDNLNVHTSGKSVNAIRSFSDKGVMVWGARTLAGNDNEWRYINVRRFYNMVEESTKKATSNFVFEPNDANTWVKVRSMIENFLMNQWRNGALAGAKPDQAYFVRVGLGETMSALDILEGRMVVEIGMAVVRPAEFIILKFSHMMQQS